jgi:MGT family glycosyltransferase
MSTVVVLNLASSGHVNPTLPLVKELVERGEFVTYYSIERYKHGIESSGAQYRSYSHPNMVEPRFHEGGHFGVMAYLAAAALAILPALLEDIKEIKPDYILLDSMCLWGNYINQILAIPCVTFSSIFVMHPKLETDRILDMSYGNLPSSTMLKGLKALHKYFQTSQKIDHKYGCISPGLIEAFSNQHKLNILFTSKLLHPLPELFNDETYKFVGPSIAHRSDNVSFSLANIESKTVIYISLGTIVKAGVQFYQDCFEAFGNHKNGESRYQVILSTGGQIDPETIDRIPSNFDIYAFVPQLEILKLADVFITHGGMNSAGEALYNGVPLVIIPQRGDNYLVMEQVIKCGAGIGMLPADTNPVSLRMAVDTILTTPSFKNEAGNIGNDLRAGGGYIRAADEIQNFKLESVL